jgi:tetratricopeptide (TPR) repeat protein
VLRNSSLRWSLIVLALALGVGGVRWLWSRPEAHALESWTLPGDVEADRLLSAARELNHAGRHQEALELFRAAAHAAESAQARVHKWASLADPCIQVGRFGEAQRALEEAGRAYADLGRADRLSEMRLRMGQVRGFLGLGLIDQVHEPLEGWRELFERGPPEVPDRWTPPLTRARLDWMNHTRRHGEAIALGDSLSPELYLDYAVQLRLGVAHWSLEQDGLALEAFERVRASPKLPDATAMQVEARLAELYWDAGNVEQARSCIDSAAARAAAQTEVLPESFEDQLHLVAVQHRMGLAGAQELELAFSRFLECWERAEPRPGGVPILGATRQRMFLTELLDSRMRRQPGEAGLVAALDALCRLQALGALARSLGGEGPETRTPFSELRRELTGERSGLLLYFPGRRGGHAFAIDAREVRLAAIPGENELAEESRELILWMVGESPKSSEDLARRGARLASFLFPDELRSQLEGWTEIGILGLGHLGAIPFELLPLSGQRLEERMAVSLPLSLPVLDVLRRRPDARSRDWSRDLVLLAAPPIPARGPDGKVAKLTPLTFDDERQRTLLGGLALPRAFARTGPAARLDGLEPDLASARILHVLTHGLPDDRRERTATLLLAGAQKRGVWIGCNEIERLSLPPVVVLSACNSGQGPPRAGDDGVADLGGACLRAGAQVVFLAPYRIRYDDACALFGLLVKELRAGRPPNFALRAARREFLARSASSDPTRGLLQVVGLGTRPVF